MGHLNQRSMLPKIVISIVIAALLGVLGFFGWHRLMLWHEEQVDYAVKQEQEKQAETRERMEQQKVLQWLEENNTRQKTDDISDARMREVFGEPVFRDAQGSESRESSCERLERKIKAFFAYLDKKREAGSGRADLEQGAYEIFEQTLDDLARKPPMISGETRDLVSLMRNRAHFFRILDKPRLELILGVLRSEKDVLEPAMADFYDYYLASKCCNPDSKGCISEQTLYDYAGFFLHTLSGKSYLMRRHLLVRTLTRYYSLLILDRANDQAINRYGIDIRPHIDLVLDDIMVQEDMIFQKRYIRRLEMLKEKYRLP